MDRLFGKSKKNAAPPPTLSDTLSKMDSRVDALNTKIRKLDAELFRYKEQLARLPPNTPSHDSVKRQALQLLQQKKQYESQRATLMGQSFNLEQATFTVESLQSTAQTVQAMKSTSRELKSQMKAMKGIESVEKLRDEMEDYMGEAQEINEVLARSYGTPEYLDEQDLEAELGALTEIQGLEDQPSYLLEELPSTSTGPLGNTTSKPEEMTTSQPSTYAPLSK